MDQTEGREVPTMSHPNMGSHTTKTKGLRSDHRRGRSVARRRAMMATATLGLTTFAASGAGAIEAGDLNMVPPPIDAEVIYLPWSAAGDPSSVNITIDGDLADWEAIPSFLTTTGPTPSPDPATNGELRWSVVAQASKLYVSATITDDSIIAGRHEDGYWNEDSIEVYLNATDDLDTATYTPGIGQVRFSAVDIGNTDPSALTLSGTNVDTFVVEGLVFATADGWGLEGVIDFSEWIEPTHGLSLGFQIHANGASTLDRDLKLIWSAADVDDVSFDQPSVFGTAVLFELGQTDVPTPAVRSKPELAATTAIEATDEVADEPAPPATTPQTTVPAVTDETEDTALIEGPAPSSVPNDDANSWSDSPLLWIVPLGFGLLSIAGFAIGRLRSASADDDDANGGDDDLPPLAP